MKAKARRFNLFPALLALALLCGCQSDKPDKEASTLRVYIEASPNTAGTTQTVSVLRSDPVLITVPRDPVLTEASIVAARIIDAPGGPGLEIQFDESSALILEQYSAANPGRHFVIFAQWGENLANGRWLAAPLITHRIANGRLSFTPDMSREEADRLVLGLNHVAKKMRKGQFK
jgi:preprotein translocase subunit SecD